jgi:AraC-like DNA-binding protein
VDYLSVNFDYTLNFRHLRDCWFPSAARDFSEDDALEHLIFYDAPALNSPVYLARASALEEPLGAMLGASLSGAPFSEERLSAMMKLAVYQALDLTRCSQDQSLREQSLAAQVIDYIDSHYADPLTNEQLSHVFSFHPVYLNRVVKSYTGRSLHQHIIGCRIRAAGELLQSGDISVSQAAASVGFSDVDHFSKSFKKVTGVAPSRCKYMK